MLISSNLCAKITYGNAQCIFKSLNIGESGTFGKEAVSTTGGKNIYSNYTVIDDHTIRVNLYQLGEFVNETIQFKNGDETLIKTTIQCILQDNGEYFSVVDNYTIEGTTPKYNIFDIDLEKIAFDNITPDTEIKIFVFQRLNKDSYCELPNLTLKLKYKITNISMPEDNKIISFEAIRDFIYPDGSIYMSMNDLDPGTFIGGTWISITSPIQNAYFWKRKD